jgi:RNA methyltransferase, TrmH family
VTRSDFTTISASNPRIAQLRRLAGRRSARHDSGLFVIEGPLLIAEAIDAGVQLDAVYIEAGTKHLAPPGIRCFDVATGVLNKIATTTTPQPMMAVAPIPSVPSEDLDGATFVVVCAGVGDPGNAGTILRSAEAAGANAVAFTAGSVDPYNPKCVRAAAGALFRVPVLIDCDVATLRLPLVGTRASEGTAYFDFDFTAPLALLLGSEAHGLDPAIEERLDATVSIPHVGRAESLNVAMAASILSFEVARQRRP